MAGRSRINHENTDADHHRAMVASILSILVIKPFEQGGSQDDTPQKTIQQPEPK